MFEFNQIYTLIHHLDHERDYYLTVTMLSVADFSILETALLLEMENFEGTTHRKLLLLPMPYLDVYK